MTGSKNTSKDKPTLTLNFNQSDEEATSARERMLERIKLLRGNIILPRKNDLALKDTDATPDTTKTAKTKPVTLKSSQDSSIANKIDNKNRNGNKDKEHKKENIAIVTKVTDTDKFVQNANSSASKSKKAKITKIDPVSRKHKISPDLVKKMKLYFQETFPLCFTNPISPLALGIHLQLRAHKQQFPDSLCTSNNVFKYLYVYTRNMQYKKALIAGANRLNIDGSIAGVVTEEEAQRAIDDLIQYEQIKQAQLAKKIAQYHDIKSKKDNNAKLKDTEKKSDSVNITNVIVDENNKTENIQEKQDKIEVETAKAEEKIKKPKRAKKLDAVEHSNSN